LDAELINIRSREMINELIDLEPRTTLQNSFYQLSKKTGLEDRQIKRIYYGEWRVIPAFIWERLKKSHAKLMDQACRNMEHKLFIIQKKNRNLEYLNREDKERLIDISNTLSRVLGNNTGK